MSTLTWAGALAAATGLFVLACGSSGSGPSSTDGGAATGGATGGAGGTNSGGTNSGGTSSGGTSSGGTSSGGTSSGGTSSGGTSSGGTSSGGTSSGGTSSGGGSGGLACALSQTPASKPSLDLYVIVDQSGSMSDTISGGATKWSALANALVQFASSTQAAGVGLGLQYSPLPDACPTTCAADADCGSCGPCVSSFCLGAGQGSCTASDYVTASVEIGTLPGNLSNIQSSLLAHGPTGTSLISAALQGSMQHAKTWATSHPDHDVALVLTADGDPVLCDANPGDLVQIAASGVAAAPRVITYAIDFGGTSATFDAIASAGGTDHAQIINPGAISQQALEAALQQARAQGGCDYSLPSGAVDPHKLNLQYTPTGGSAQIVPMAFNAGSCPASGLAWYYDDPTAPTRFELCPAACGTVDADTTGKLEVVYGCSTLTL